MKGTRTFANMKVRVPFVVQSATSTTPLSVRSW
jgi:hypothetical protein